MEIITYKELMVKYPAMKEDLERLKESKEAQVTGNRIAFFILGVVASYFVYVFIPSVM